MLREDLAEWLSRILGAGISEATLMQARGGGEVVEAWF